MGLGLTFEAVALDSTCEATPFGSAYHIYSLAHVEDADRDLLSLLVLFQIRGANFAQVAQGRQITLAQMTTLPPGQTFGFDFLEAQLYRLVPIPLQCLLLDDETRPSLDNRNRDNLSTLVEYLGHTHFLT